MNKLNATLSEVLDVEPIGSTEILPATPVTKVDDDADFARDNIRTLIEKGNLAVDGVWYADYALAVVVHIDGRHGCKIFGFLNRELDYDHKKSKPAMRLMTEVYKVSELFQSLADVLEDRHVEVHLDLNKSDEHGSSCVVQQAIGYIKGTCNMTPMVKPDAPAASFCADRLKRILAEQELSTI